MIFDNINNLQVVTDFEKNYGSKLCGAYPELVSMGIRIYTDKQGTGFIKKWDDRNNSPYTSNHVVNEIMRSEDVYNKCGFTCEEEFAILVHELGHIIAGKRGQKSMDNLLEELNADQMAASLGLANHMACAIQKMIDLNINPANNGEMKLRENALSHNKTIQIMTPISVTYSDDCLRTLVEEFITMQKHDFTFKSLCSYVLYRAMEEVKTANTGLYETNQMSPADCERISNILRKIIKEGRLTCGTDTFVDDTRFVKVKE